MRLNSKIALLTAAFPEVVLHVTGTSVRCVASGEDFDLSFDEGPKIPFGIARRVTPTDDGGNPISFKRVGVHRRVGASVASNEIELLIGDADYTDNRIALFSSEGIRQQPFTGMTGVPVSVANGATATEISDGTVQDVVNVRNTSETDSVFVSTDETEIEADEENGFEIAPGENVDFPVSNPLFSRHAAASPIVLRVTKFVY